MSSPQLLRYGKIKSLTRRGVSIYLKNMEHPSISPPEKVTEDGKGGNNGKNCRS